MGNFHQIKKLVKKIARKRFWQCGYVGGLRKFSRLLTSVDSILKRARTLRRPASVSSSFFKSKNAP